MEESSKPKTEASSLEIMLKQAYQVGRLEGELFHLNGEVTRLKEALAQAEKPPAKTTKGSAKE
jgi:hypothetical protein